MSKKRPPSRKKTPPARGTPAAPIATAPAASPPAASPPAAPPSAVASTASQRNWPAFRRLRVYAFDPSLETQLENAVVNQITLKVPWESNLAPDPGEPPGDGQLGAGPVGEYLEVVDYDPASGCFYAPVHLNDPILLGQDGLAPSEGTPQFHQQMVYAVAMTTIKTFERALGRLAFWAPRFLSDGLDEWKAEFVRRLRIYPHALRQANAYYSPQKKALLFGYFPADASDPAGHMPGTMVFTCLSHDIVVHETTHALLDGLHRRFIEPSNPDSLAFHEAFADLCALFQHFSFPEVLKHQISKTRGDLGQQNLLGELAQEFGRATGSRGALRSALGHWNPEKNRWEPWEPTPGEYQRTSEPHTRGAHLVAAVFDAFLSIYKSRVADLLRIASGGTGRLPEGQLSPDLVNRLAAEAAKSARHVLAMCIRALDYCPPVDITFGEYLRALITADYDLVRDDERGYRIAMIEAFRRRGIYPLDVRTLSEESLCWRSPIPHEQDVLRAAMPSADVFQKTAACWDLNCNRESVFGELQGTRAHLHNHLKAQLPKVPEAFRLLGLDPELNEGRFEVHALRPARRIGPDGQQILELVVEITQRQPVFFQDGNYVRPRTWTREQEQEAEFWFRGGCTLLIDPEKAQVRYVIVKRIDSQARFEQQSNYVRGTAASLRATYFGSFRRAEEAETFALLHRSPLEVNDE